MNILDVDVKLNISRKSGDFVVPIELTLPKDTEIAERIVKDNLLVDSMSPRFTGLRFRNYIMYSLSLDSLTKMSKKISDAINEDEHGYHKLVFMSKTFNVNPINALKFMDNIVFHDGKTAGAVLKEKWVDGEITDEEIEDYIDFERMADESDDYTETPDGVFEFWDISPDEDDNRLLSDNDFQ